MNERPQNTLDADRRPVVPQWSIHPRENEHAPEGRPPFDILFAPETPRVIELRNVFFNQEGTVRKTDYPELEDGITQAIERRKQGVDVFNRDLRARMVAEGKTEEEIVPKKFFDGKLARLHPRDIVPAGNELLLRLGETTYFTYAGSRDRKALNAYGYDRLGLALAVCTVATAPSEDGTQKLLYTIRQEANESYPAWFHTVGGTVQTLEKGMVNPNQAVKREVTEELGLEADEFALDGIAGIVMNNFDIHPEILYTTTIATPVEQWFGKRTTDKEVEAAYFTDTPENLEAFVLGQKTAELPDARPIVPSGLSNYLLHGRIRYGEDWYNSVLQKLPQY